MFEMPEEYVSSVLRVHCADNLEAQSDFFLCFPVCTSLLGTGGPHHLSL